MDKGIRIKLETILINQVITYRSARKDKRRIPSPTPLDFVFRPVDGPYTGVAEAVFVRLSSDSSAPSSSSKGLPLPSSSPSSGSVLASPSLVC